MTQTNTIAVTEARKAHIDDSDLRRDVMNDVKDQIRSPLKPHDDAHQSRDEFSVVESHPLGIKPAGNAYGAIQNIKSMTGYFAILSDEIIIQVFENLDVVSLQKVASTCKALYAFATLEELWKTITVESAKTIISWRGSWRSTMLQFPNHYKPSLDCTFLFSDVLHRPFFCSSIALDSYSTNIPERNAIARLTHLDPRTFLSDWTEKPFILANCVTQWPIYQEWSTEYLLSNYGEVDFRAESVDWPLRTYIAYSRNNHDESPLYLFDRSFVEKMTLDTASATWAYSVPSCFGQDLFSVLGAQRPDHRWLIIGPARSGSTFHKDPNATSAWNAVVRGAKYWIMFPSKPGDPPPPGVYVSADQSEVTSPLSIVEWLVGFHAQARKTPGCKEGICYAGEVLHVPSGWWHLVINLEESIAITQNFVPAAHLPQVLDFLKNKPDQVSGFDKSIENPYELFVERMTELHPEILEQALEQLAARTLHRKRKWNELINTQKRDDSSDTEGFNFGFASDDDADVP